MGMHEKELRKKLRNRNLEKVVLSVVLAAGILTIGSVAPNSLSLLQSFPGFKKRKRQKEILNNTRNRLIQKGLLVRDGGSVRLTKEGERRLRILEREEFQFKKPKKWDGKWRVLIFDIKESRRSVRDKVRHTLLQIGFICLQKSVWVFPYDCEDLITLVKADLEIGKDVLYMIVDSFENERNLRLHFKLPLK